MAISQQDRHDLRRIGYVTAAAGLGVAGTKGSAALIRLSGKGGRKGFKIARRMDEAGNAVGAMGAGAAGLSALPLAENQEPRPKKRKPIVKAFNPERSRKRRLVAYQTGLAGGAVGTGAAALSPVAANAVKQVKTRNSTRRAAVNAIARADNDLSGVRAKSSAIQRKANAMPNPGLKAIHGNKQNALGSRAKQAASMKRNATAALASTNTKLPRGLLTTKPKGKLLAVSAGLTAASAAVGHYRNNGGRSHSVRYHSPIPR